MTLDRKVALGVSFCGTAVANFLGGWDMALRVLILFMTLDYITGITRAYKDKELSSAVGIDGILKKMMILFIVAVAVGIDNTTGAQGIIRQAAVWFYTGMEGISILENAAVIGVPIPEKMKEALAQIKEGGKKSTTVIETTISTEVTTEETEKEI